MDANTIGLIAIITSIGSLLVIFLKTIKKSSCFGCNAETRTPPPSINIPYNSSSPKTETDGKEITNVSVV